MKENGIWGTGSSDFWITYRLFIRLLGRYYVERDIEMGKEMAIQ